MKFIDNWMEARRRKAARRLGRFEIFPRDDGGFGFRFRAANNLVTLTTADGFSRDRDARRAIRNLKKAVDAPIVMMKPEAAPAGSNGP